MKKKTLLLVIVLAVIVFIGAASFLSISKKNKNDNMPVNSSRRDGQVVDSTLGHDEDLEAVIGEGPDDSSLNMKNAQEALNASKREEADEELYSSLESVEATRPTVESVESVELLLLPESVTIGDGDIDAFYDNKDFADVEPVDADTFAEMELAASYDSRDVDGKRYVTDVEDQGYTYLCWSYAAIGAVESDILRHNPDISYDSLDLSEKHLAYYNMHKNGGSYGGLIDDDYRELVNADDESGAWIFEYDTNYMAMGGVSDFCISLLSAWKGPVSEQGDDAYAGLYGEKHMFQENGIKPSDAYNAEYHIQDVSQLPSTILNRKMIKKMILEHGSVTGGVYADKEFWSGNKSNLYATFNGDIEPADHEIIVLGWDDEYPAAKFKNRPPGDGAWICRNSWGEGIGQAGFFYLSYYDQTFGINNVTAYTVVSPDDDDFYDNNYQTAGFLTYVVSSREDDKNYVTAYSASKNPYGMLYTAITDETLRAIGLMALDAYQQYELEIYINPKSEDGNLNLSDLKHPKVSQKVSAISGGYHTFKLQEELELAAGDEFFVLVKPQIPGRLAFETAVDNITQPNYDEWNNLTGNIHNCYTASGLSYYIAEDGKSYISQSDKDFFIKAYTNNKKTEIP